MIATLPMYDLPEARDATDALWAGIARHLRAEGVADVPPALARSADHESAWRDPSLLLSQSCGYPVTHAFADALRIVATPVHEIAGCEDGRYHSLVIVRDDASFAELARLRGTVAAVNDHASQSGKNALFALLAPLGRGRFFAEVIVSGSHVASIEAVRQGRAAVAAIDCVTHALLARFRPSALAGTRILAKTASAPALPWVTRREASDSDVERLRAGLLAAMTDPELAAVRAELLLGGAIVLSSDAYDVIREMERSYTDL